MILLPLVSAVLQAPAAAVWPPHEIAGAVVRSLTGLLVAWLAYRLARRVPWPSPFRLPFAALHLVGAPLAGLLWFASTAAVMALLPWRNPDASMTGRVFEHLVLGSVFYAIIVGVAHAVEASARAARAEAAAAHAQLAALRAQLHPHFLFNALHTVVQLIPADPARAMEAAELVANLLRTALEEQRDEVTLRDEWHFASRYLAVEQIRFGDRLRVRADVPPDLLDARVPAFALQTLVENAVRHGAAPRVAPTDIAVVATGSGAELTLSVRNTGDHVSGEATAPGAGTGLARLRERLAVLYGRAAQLVCAPEPDGGFLAQLVLPRRHGAAS